MANPSRWVESSSRPNVVADPLNKKINGWYYLGLCMHGIYGTIDVLGMSIILNARVGIMRWDPIHVPEALKIHTNANMQSFVYNILTYNTLRRTLAQHHMLLLTCSRPMVSHAIPIKIIFWGWNEGPNQGGATPYSTDTDVKGGRGHGRL